MRYGNMDQNINLIKSKIIKVNFSKSLELFQEKLK